MKVIKLNQDFSTINIAVYPFDHDPDIRIVISRGKNIATKKWGSVILSWERGSLDDPEMMQKFLLAYSKAVQIAHFMENRFKEVWNDNWEDSLETRMD